MYSLLIVDDEPEIVEFLHGLLSEIEDLELYLYKAFSGEEAVEWLNRVRMDMVVTDMRMPGISGLELLHRIKANWPSCRVLFLTGHKDFETIYEATRFPDVQYLLKTAGSEEIVQSVRSMVTRIEEGLPREEFSDSIRTRIQQATPLLRQELLERLLLGEASEELVQEDVTNLGMGLQLDLPVYLVLGRFDRLTPSIRLLGSPRFHVLNVLADRHLFGCRWHGCVVLDNMYLVWMIQVHPHETQTSASVMGGIQGREPTLMIRSAFESIQSDYAASETETVSFACSTRAEDSGRLGELALSLRQALNSRFGTEGQMLLTERNALYPDTGTDFQQEGVSERLPHHLTYGRSLETCLDVGAREEFQRGMASCAACFPVHTSMSSPYVIELYYLLSMQFMSHINRFRLHAQLAFETGLFRLSSVNEFPNWGEAIRYLEELSERIFRLQENRQTERTGAYVSIVRQHVEANLDQDISLVRLADLVSLHPAYLSRLFKQTTGIKLSEYIMQQKLELARRLLADKSMRIGEISTRVGFYTPSYFTRFFKRMTGVSPQEYRDTLG